MTAFVVAGYLCSEVIGVVSLWGCEVGIKHSLGHVDSDFQVLHCLPHSLLGSNGDIEATARSCLEETDALLHIHWNGYKTEEGHKKNNGYNKPEWLVVWMFLFKSIKSELFHLQVRKWCLRLLLSADVIGHEREVSIRWDERQDTLRLPAPEPHAWVETHVIKKPRILSSTARSVKKAKHWRLGIKDWEEVTPP